MTQVPSGMEEIDTAPKSTLLDCYYAQNDDAFNDDTPEEKRRYKLINRARFWCGKVIYEWRDLRGFLCKTPTHWKDGSQ